MIDRNDPVGVCSKCSTKMKLIKHTDHCVANVILEDKDGKEYRDTIFNDVWKKIVSLEEVAGEGDMADQLLATLLLNFTINHKDIICDPPSKNQPSSHQVVF